MKSSRKLLAAQTEANNGGDETCMHKTDGKLFSVAAPIMQSRSRGGDGEEEGLRANRWREGLQKNLIKKQNKYFEK